MAKKIDKIREELIGEVYSQTELENYMSEQGFEPVECENPEDEKENIIKFTNYKSQVWIECEHENIDILICNVKNINRVENNKTRVEPFKSYEDLEKVLSYFWNNKLYHHWLISGLMTSLGRRIGDTVSLKWSDFFDKNGNYKARLETLKEEKTGKVVGVRINALAKYYIAEYCKILDINPVIYYKEKIFSIGSAGFRKALKKAIDNSNLRYPLSTHSFRKFYANTIFKIHPQDNNNLAVIQKMMGHSDSETTKVYIGEYDRMIDVYNQDFSEYILKKMNGEDCEISNSPILSIKWEDFREILSKCWDMGNNGMDKFESINEILGIAEECML